MNDFCVNLYRVNSKDFSMVSKALHYLDPGSLPDFISTHISLSSLCNSTTGSFLFVCLFLFFFKYAKQIFLGMLFTRYKLLYFFEVFSSNVIFSLAFCYIKCQLTLSVLPVYYAYQNMPADYINYVLIE